MASVAATAAVRSVQATIAIGALSVWIASQLPDCLEAVDACSDLYNLFPLESPTSTIPRSSSSSRPRATAAPLLSPRSLLAAALLISSFRIFGFYLSLLALFLFLLCYFTGTPVYSYSQAVRRSRRLNSFFSNARRPSFPLKFKLARPRFRMLRKQLLSKGKEPFRPLYGASSKASIAFARWGTDKTSALIRSVKSHGRGIRKAAYYSTVRPDNQTGTGTGGAGPEWGPGLPLYRQCFHFAVEKKNSDETQGGSSLRGRRRRRNGTRFLLRLGRSCSLRFSIAKKSSRRRKRCTWTRMAWKSSSSRVPGMYVLFVDVL